MIDFRIPAAAMLLVGLTLSVAAAEGTVTEDLSPDTSMQHHLWSQKFETSSSPKRQGPLSLRPFLAWYDSPRLRPGRAGLQQPSFPGLAYRVLLISSKAEHRH